MPTCRLLRLIAVLTLAAAALLPAPVHAGKRPPPHAPKPPSAVPCDLDRVLDTLATLTHLEHAGWLKHMRRMISPKKTVDSMVEETFVAVALSRESILEDWSDLANDWIYFAPDDRRARLEGALNRQIQKNSQAPRLNPSAPAFKTQPLQDLVIITHQSDVGLADKTAQFLAQNPELKSVPRVALVDPAFPLASRSLQAQVSGALFSAGGEIPDLPPLQRLHLMGGYCSMCMFNSLDDTLTGFFADPGRAELEIVLHSDFIYTDNGITLTQDLQSKQAQATDPGSFWGGNWAITQESLGLQRVSASDKDGVVFKQGKTGKTIRIKVVTGEAPKSP